MILFPAAAVVAMSNTIGKWLPAGTAYENGFVENTPVVPPNGGTMLGPFWNTSATNPRSAARAE